MTSSLSFSDPLRPSGLEFNHTCTVYLQVPKIPKTFMSTDEYMNSFIPALIEETHSDLSSSLINLSQAPFCEILTIEPSPNFDPPNALFCQITVKSSATDDVGKYEPEVGDIFAFTDVRPRSIHDLTSLKRHYHIAYVRRPKDGFTEEIPILLSKYMEMNGESDLSNKKQKLYAVYLMNMTTNIRIWRALNSQLEGADMNNIKKVLQVDSRVSKNE